MLKVSVIFILFCPFTIASLHSRFRHFEELIPLHINIRHKRDNRNPQIYTKLVHFDALGKSFHLQLFPDNSIFSDDFQVQFIDAVGQVTTTTINTDGLYSGHEKNDPKNKVNAVHHEDEWYFYVQTPEDVFVIEPISRLDPQKTGNKLIAYRSRDVLTNTSKHSSDKLRFCKASRDFHVKEKVSQHIRGLNHKKIRRQSVNHVQEINPDIHKLTGRDKFGNHDQKSKQRQRRMSVDVADTCDVFVVVDYLTYAGVGRKSPDAIVKWISHLLKCVDQVFRNSGLKVDGVTYGVMLRGIMIHTEFSKVPASNGNMEHYNMELSGAIRMNVTETVMNFMLQDDVKGMNNYCVAHLISGRNFGGILGVGTVATPSWDDPNGICMAYNFQEKDYARNGGLTTSIDDNDNALDFDTQTLTMAHEIGHNFGADHDSDNDKCGPSSDEGGKYLMWPTIGAPRGRNSRYFSPCSIPLLRAVIKAKAHKCFRSKNSLRRFCGNGIVTAEEDCDFGPLNDTTKDRCCTSSCRFSPGAVCSPNHHPCCTKNCQIAPKTQACIRDVTNDCVKDSTCDGVDAFSCPRPSPKKNGSPCGENGTCWQGLCMRFCENLGRVSSPPRHLQSCNCDQDTTMMCKLCCLDLGRNSPCVPMGGVRINGSICLKGVCQKGVCKPREVELMIGKAYKDDSDSQSTSSSTIITLLVIGIAFAVAVIAVAGTLFSGKKVKRSSSEEVNIKELRKSLQEAIGHLNVSPYGKPYPETKVIEKQLEQDQKQNTK